MSHLTKVTVVGAGQVGVACAVSILSNRLCDELALVDIDTKKVEGEVQDLKHGSLFLHNANVVGSDNYAVSAGSSVVVITAGVRQREGESRLALVQRNVQIFKGIVPQIVEHSPNAVLIVVSNPCDIMTFVAWKLSGFPHSRVFGSGTTLDTARFRQILSSRLGVGSSSVHGWVIGEHGDSSVPVWSQVNIAGVPYAELLKRTGKDTADFPDAHKEVVEAAANIIKLKGYTNWGIGLSVAMIVEGIVRNKRSVFALSTLVKGYHGIENETFVSLPCVLGARGITSVIPMKLSDEEELKFSASVETVWSVIKDVQL